MYINNLNDDLVYFNETQFIIIISKLIIIFQIRLLYVRGLGHSLCVL